MSEDKSWLQCICQTTKKHHLAIEEVMESAGALSITWQDAKDTPVLEPLPGEQLLWEDMIITGLFEKDTDLSALSDTLSNNQSAWDIEEFHIETLENQDWERVWMKDFHPIQFGEKLWIYPSNYDIPEENPDGHTYIHLDPGLAFGTGTHPTTALCLEWLDQNPPKDLNVVDYGSGSGILAVAAVLLGATHINATDIDPQALIATADNMLRNDIPVDKISNYLPDDCPKKEHDLVLANILCGPLIELFPTIASLTRTGGKLVLSGLLEEQQADLIETYSASFTDFKVKSLDGWIRISATKI
ncbi:MAG: 50S ribosomal protein L11 methyltransferase [Cocleimonas sp.]